MLITFAGLHGTGKTTVARRVAEALGLPHVSTGQVFRDMARAAGVDLVEFSRAAASDPRIDKELDRKMKERGEQGDVVLDGQLCWYFLGDKADWKVLLTCDEEVRLERILKRERERDPSITLDDVKRETLSRERIEQERYREFYGVDLSDQDALAAAHDIVVDTTKLSIDEVTQEILERMGVGRPGKE